MYFHCFLKCNGLKEKIIIWLKVNFSKKERVHYLKKFIASTPTISYRQIPYSKAQFKIGVLREGSFCPNPPPPPLLYTTVYLLTASLVRRPTL